MKLLIVSAFLGGTYLSRRVECLSSPTATSPKSFNEVPGPPKWPIVGTLPDFVSRGGADAMINIHQALYREYGDVYFMSIFGNDEAVFCDPREFERVFHSEGKYPSGGAQEGQVFIDYHEAKGNEVALKTLSSGDDWRDWRQNVNPDVFRLDAAKSYIPHITAATTVASKVANKYPNDFYDFISRLAFDMFSGVMLGSSPGTVDAATVSPEDLKFVKDTQDAFNLAGTIMVSPEEKLFKSERYNNFIGSMDNALNFARNRTKQFAESANDLQNQVTFESECPVTGSNGFRTKARGLAKNAKSRLTTLLSKKTETTSSQTLPPPSCVERLIARGEMPLDDISETVATMLLAGVDTTAYVLGWLFINLASNLSVQEKLAAELENVLQGSDFSESTFDRLPYLRACIRESHRLTPVGPITGIRRLPKDVNMNGYTFPAGTKLSLNQVAYQMDPKYVEDPQAYRPERWLKDAVEKRKGTQAEVIDHKLLATPFGAGARMCLGARVAEIEIMVAMARLVQDWKITLDPPEQTWGTKQGLFIKADPFPKFKLVPR